jgi:hypothetical protein
MFEIRSILQPALAEASRELRSAVEAETVATMKHIADYVPEEMRIIMDSATRTGKPATRKSGDAFTRSAFGEIPAKDSFELYDSLEAKADGKTVTLQMAEHGKFLDPLFDDDEYLNRPFIETGLDNTVKRLEKA